MRNPLDTLTVTLLSGLNGIGKPTVASVISGTPHTPASGFNFVSLVTHSEQYAVELAGHLRDLADRGRRGHIVIELEAHADTAEIAAALEHQLAESYEHRVVIGDVITVASVRDILGFIFLHESVVSGRADVAGADGIAERLALQLEFATVIVLSDCATVSVDARREVEGLVFRLNPTAATLPIESLATDFADGSDIWMQRRAPRAASIEGAMGWIRELTGRSHAVGSGTAIESFVFRDPRPFHPGRLADVIEDLLESQRYGRLLRSRGLVRLASRIDRVASWSSAGLVLTVEPTTALSWDGDSPIGQELVIFGADLNHEKLAAAFGDCLLTGDELMSDPAEWSGYRDPFPKWRVGIL